MVALNGNPLGAGAAFGAVYAASLANGGSYDDIAPGIQFFGELARLGNLNPAAASPASLISGPDPGSHQLGLSEPRLQEAGSGKG